jgi:DNA-binding NarL/FixJ family response regulator
METNPKPLVKIIIADDHRLFADGVEQIIRNMAGYEVIANVDNGKLLLQVLNRLQPDIILLDISMPFMDGLETALQIKKKKPEIKILFISMHYDSGIKSFIQLNDISGFVIKNISAQELKDAIHKVTEGGKVFIPPQQAQLPEASLPPGSEFINQYKLTKTEISIIKLIVAGDNTKTIADKRSLSYLTVESHRKNILRKLKAKNMAEVVAFAVKYGLA